MKGYMGKDFFKSFLKTVRRSQSQLKYALFFLLLIVIAAAVGYKLTRKFSLPSVQNDIKIGQLTDVDPNATPTLQPQVAPQPKISPIPTPKAKVTMVTSKTQKRIPTYAVKKGQKVVAKVAKPATKLKAKPTNLKSYTYVVKKGDSLWKISQKNYKSGHQWTTIYQANKKVIGSNPRLIHPQTRLVIPRR
jgi:nucleoid-associated protein YgaU